MSVKDPEKKRARERRKYASRVARDPEKMRAKWRRKKLRHYWADPIRRQVMLIRQARRRIAQRREQKIFQIEQLAMELSNG